MKEVSLPKPKPKFHLAVGDLKPKPESVAEKPNILASILALPIGKNDPKSQQPEQEINAENIRSTIQSKLKNMVMNKSGKTSTLRNKKRR